MEGKPKRGCCAIRSEPRDAPSRESNGAQILVGFFNGCVDIRLQGDSLDLPVTLSGPVNDLGNGEGLEGVEVCILNTSTCTTTDADGTYLIDGVPAESNVSLSVTMPEYLGGVIPVMTGSEAMTVPVVSMGSELLSELQIGILDVPAVEDAGQIAFSISNGIFGDRINVPGIRVALEPAAGDGPFIRPPAACRILSLPRPPAMAVASSSICPRAPTHCSI